MEGKSDIHADDCDALNYMKNATQLGQQMSTLTAEMKPLQTSLLKLFKKTGDTSGVELPQKQEDFTRNMETALKVYALQAGKAKSLPRSEMKQFEEACKLAAEQHKDLMKTARDEINTLEFYIENMKTDKEKAQNREQYHGRQAHNSLRFSCLRSRCK